MEFEELGHSSSAAAARKIIRSKDFHRQLYALWFYQGFRSIVSLQITTVCNLLFSITLSSLLLLTDWAKLMNDCGQGHCHGSVWHFVSLPSDNLFVAVFATLFMCYLCYVGLRGALRIQEASTIQGCLTSLGISQKEAAVLTWIELVNRIHEAAEAEGGDSRDRQQTEEEIAATIMRNENWLVAMIRDGRVLSLTLPWTAVVTASPQLELTKSVEFALSFIVLQFMYEEKEGPYTFDDGHGHASARMEGSVGTVYKGGFEYQPLLGVEPAPEEEEEEEEEGRRVPALTGSTAAVSSLFLAEPKRLKMRFLTVGWVLLLLLPFMSLYATIHFVLDNLTEWHRNSSYLGPRVISPLYRYHMRRYNELPHQLERRVDLASQLASEFISHSYFASPTLTHVTQSVEYISGSLMAVLLLLSLAGDNALLSLTLAPPTVDDSEDLNGVVSHNLFWVLTVLSALYAGSRSVRARSSSRPSSVCVAAHHRAVAKEQPAFTACAANSGDAQRETDTFHLGREEGKDADDFRKHQELECQALLLEWRRVCEGRPDGTAAFSSAAPGLGVNESVEPSHLFLYRERLQSLFPHRLHLFLLEIFSAVQSPLLLLLVFSTDEACDRITSFVATNKVNTDKCGEVFKCSAPAVAIDVAVGVDSSERSAAEQRLDDAVYVNSPQAAAGEEEEDGKEVESNLRSRRSLLRSVLLEQNIEYSNDSYWRERMVQD